MRYQVPQFIEVEDKIFGPLTFKQFIYLVGGAGLSIAFFFTLPKFLAYPFIAVVMLLSLALAFYKVNNKPFVIVMLSAFAYFFGAKLYVWKKPTPKKIKARVEESSRASISLPKIPGGTLRDTQWNLGVNSSIYSTQETQRKTKEEDMKKYSKQDASPSDLTSTPKNAPES